MTPLLVAIGLIAVAIADGGYSHGAVAALALIGAWTLCLALALRLVPRAEIPRPAILAALALAGLALLTLLSIGWAADNGGAFSAAVLATLYALVFSLAVLFSSRSSAGGWILGLTLGLAGVSLLALASRWFPGLAPDKELQAFLPGFAARLGYPIGYWNGLGAVLGLFICLLGWHSVSAKSPGWRSLATGSLPLPALGLFLTSSRGGVLAAVVGVTVLLALVEKRSLLLGSLAIAAPGGALLILIAESQSDLLDGLQTGAATHQGAAMLIASLGVVAATALLRRGLDRPLDRASVPPAAGRAGLIAAVVLLAVVVVASDPGKRLDDLKAPPTATQGDQNVASHLTSGSGSGRYQFWQAAIDAFKEKPVAGIGAGGYLAWWNQHGSIEFNLRNAHSLFLETLAELGLLGLALIAVFFVVTFAAGVARRRSQCRSEVAALMAILAAGTTSAAIDWTWQIPAVFGPVVIAAALLTGAATLPSRQRRPAAGPGGEMAMRTRVAVALAAAAALAASAIALTAQLELDSSQDSSRSGDLAAAARDARSAAAIEPWAAAPRLQLALVEERAGDLRGALNAIGDAAERDNDDWKVWLVAARLNLKAGDVPAAERALARSRHLNPHSVIFRLPPAPG